MIRRGRAFSVILTIMLLAESPVCAYAGELTTEDENDSTDYDDTASYDSEYGDGGYSYSDGTYTGTYSNYNDSAYDDYDGSGYSDYYGSGYSDSGYSDGGYGGYSDYASTEADSSYTDSAYDMTGSYGYLYGSMDVDSMWDIMSIIDKDLVLSAASTYVPEIYQKPELPTGCESVALTIALEHYGFTPDKTTIADYYLPYGYNYIWNYVGDPYSDSGACIMAPGLSNAANAYLTDQGSTLYARDITGFEFTDLYKLVEEGYPVVVWTTMYMQEPSLSGSTFWYNGRGYEWYWNEHCVVLCGYDETTGTVTVSDPLDGIVQRDAATFEYIYNLTGQNALVIM